MAREPKIDVWLVDESAFDGGLQQAGVSNARAQQVPGNLMRNMTEAEQMECLRRQIQLGGAFDDMLRFF